MQILQTSIPDVVLIDPWSFNDVRGFLLETWSQQRYEQAGLPAHFVQDNHSRSTQGVLRGLHYQVERPQGKLVSVARGAAFDVAVDLRRSSPTFGRWTAAELSDQNHRQMYLPPGFAHGFYALSDYVDVVYKCTDYYDADLNRTLLWSDPQVGIVWPASNPILSARDQHGQLLANLPTFD